MADSYPAFSPRQNIPLSQSAAATGRQYQQSQRDLNYKVFVVATDQKILVDAWLPETIGMDVSASYDAPLAQGLLGSLPAIGSLAKFVGLALTTQAFTIQVWQGGTYIDFTFPLIFQAENNSARDVMKPIKDLLKLTMPKDPYNGGLLEAPGPRLSLDRLASNGLENVTNIAGAGISTLWDTGKQVATGNLGQALIGIKSKAAAVAQPTSSAIWNAVENNISLYVGKFLYLPAVVVTDVSPTFDVQIGPDNNPMKATVNVTFRTFYTLTDKDIEVIFPAATEAIIGK